MDKLAEQLEILNKNLSTANISSGIKPEPNFAEHLISTIGELTRQVNNLARHVNTLNNIIDRTGGINKS